ncbi:hypothetical protein LTR56_009301 [Elasticomyces elasticus]|nr:hypothetical protein LTR22_021094 [Elasticomyces elasticus]KAK3644914.1 hypothetical protein LTR56_009301 [Elasticomyces elasticus]KAK4917764.1 hypothetical protein LTR49_014441 [Elasticomyces elasticus]KAK5766325.1 hypothetical protein LTS12_003536 [Elasticomyces elasticus]
MVGQASARSRSFTPPGSGRVAMPSAPIKIKTARKTPTSNESPVPFKSLLANNNVSNMTARITLIGHEIDATQRLIDQARERINNAIKEEAAAIQYTIDLTSAKPWLPGNIANPRYLVRKQDLLVKTRGYKSKEIDSGIAEWETPTDFDESATSYNNNTVGVAATSTAHQSVTTATDQTVATTHATATTHNTNTATPATQSMLQADPILAAIFARMPTVWITDLAPRFTRSPRPINEQWFRRELMMAQLHYPGDFCLMIGNLSNQHTTLELTMAVLDKFVQYGEVYGAVFNHFDQVTQTLKPYAILQFTNADDAMDAHLMLGAPLRHGHKIAGRTIRTAWSNQRRTLISFYLDEAVPSA